MPMPNHIEGAPPEVEALYLSNRRGVGTRPVLTLQGRVVFRQAGHGDCDHAKGHCQFDTEA